MELPGLKYSTFAKTVQGKSLVILFNLISGVLPIVSKILFFHINFYLVQDKKNRGQQFYSDVAEGKRQKAKWNYLLFHLNPYLQKN